MLSGPGSPQTLEGQVDPMYICEYTYYRQENRPGQIKPCSLMILEANLLNAMTQFLQPQGHQ